MTAGSAIALTFLFHASAWFASAQFFQAEYGTSLTVVDYLNADRLPERPIFHSTSADPLTAHHPLPQLFEGDIHLNNIPLRYYTQEQPGMQRDRWHNAIRSPVKKWDNAEIPILVSSKFSTYERSRIAAAVKEFEKYSCVRFVPRVDETDYVYIHKGSGCYSLVGRHGGKQPLSVGIGCMAKGIIMHEMMHAAGFFHEQSRADRDDHINIVYDNVMDDAVDQFQKYSLKTIDHLEAPYDYGSIMHYGSYAFSKNKKKTVVPRKGDAEIGQRRGFSPIDIQKLNTLYTCQKDGSSLPDPVSPSVTLPPTTTLGTCLDTRPDCVKFLHKCHTPKGKIYCSKTCKHCDPHPRRKEAESNCSDVFPERLCKSLKGQGHCGAGALKSLTRLNCCKTCNTDEAFHYNWA